MVEAVCNIDLVVVLYNILPKNAPALALHWLDAQAKHANLTVADIDYPIQWLAHKVAQNNIESFDLLHTYRHHQRFVVCRGPQDMSMLLVPADQYSTLVLPWCS